jgi:hypothetical protein
MINTNEIKMTMKQYFGIESDIEKQTFKIMEDMHMKFIDELIELLPKGINDDELHLEVKGPINKEKFESRVFFRNVPIVFIASTFNVLYLRDEEKTKLEENRDYTITDEAKLLALMGY